MTNVIIAGIGQTPVNEHWDTSLRELAFHAMEAAMQDADGLRPTALYVGNMLAGQLSKQTQLATLLADFAGLTGIEAATVEAAGASAAMALRAGTMAVSSGMVDFAMVLGVEKLSEQVPAEVEAALAMSSDTDYEAEQGMTLTAQAAMLAQRYVYEHKVPEHALAGFAVTAHANGAHNPNAMFRKAIKPETYAKAGLVSAPLNLFDVAPNADGAAALILTRRELLPPKFSHPLVEITGSSAVTDTLALHDRPDPLIFNAARLSIERACAQAGILPKDADFFELFDAFSIYSALTLEAAGLAARGEGWKLAQNGAISLTGEMPITTLGGLKARGFPGGATGAYQAAEAALQLRGQAGGAQIAGAKTALVQSLGGPASTAVTHVLKTV
ncbi:MAG: thiolase domain-containing protein [Anaerolineales bacterium]|nr:thiolase domain-containing protein [Anaerolineales bacterium]MBX3004984.1 thiolase domain-containing protein [Anaerolineales bacterium]MCW5886830.1 thiolase domain-containing protein [Anaerolineales bacterium]